MFSSKFFINDVNEIPSNWIFENYLGLSQKLSGQSIRINSLFNINDKTPSMYIYYNTESNSYKYKCFSTGKSGGPVDLMMHIWSVSFYEASQRIIKDYSDYLKTGKICETKIIEHSKWKVDKCKTRGWTKNDAEFWSEYNISSHLLQQYNVVPIDRYVMQKVSHDKNVENEFSVVSKHIYGYFTKEGILYKIYQPKNKERKFIKICDYIQGYEQLQNKPILIIASSLKDCMAIRSMNLNVDVVAPDSENSILHEDVIYEFKDTYQSIVTVFDSDEAGIKAMKAYEEKYGIPFCYLPLEKDIADIVKVHGVKKAIYEFVPKLNNAIDKYSQLQLADD
jgi:hypothetical protein